MGLAASAAQLALWRWDLPRDVIWVSPQGRGLCGIPESEVVSRQRFLDAVHPDDREATQQALTRALENGVA